MSAGLDDDDVQAWYEHNDLRVRSGNVKGTPRAAAQARLDAALLAERRAHRETREALERLEREMFLSSRPCDECGRDWHITHQSDCPAALASLSELPTEETP